MKKRDGGRTDAEGIPGRYAGTILNVEKSYATEYHGGIHSLAELAL